MPAPRVPLEATSTARRERSPWAARAPSFWSWPRLVRAALPRVYRLPRLLMPSLEARARSPVAVVVPVSRIRPSWVQVKPPSSAASRPWLLTPTPASVPRRWILRAYIPPRWPTSTATPGLPSALAASTWTPRPAKATWLAPVMTFRLPGVRSWPLTCRLRAIRSSWSRPLPFRPWGPICSWPALTRKPSRPPAGPSSGAPVVSMPRLVLMKPPPLQTMPLGLAMITSARVPATSMRPSSRLGLVPSTWLRMTWAEPAFSSGLAPIVPPNWVWTGPVALLRITPWGSTSNRWKWLLDRPAPLGATICTTGGRSLEPSSTTGWFRLGASGADTTCACSTDRAATPPAQRIIMGMAPQ